MNRLTETMEWLKNVHYKLERDYADIGSAMACHVVSYLRDNAGPLLLCSTLPRGDVTEVIMTQSVQRTVVVDGVRFVSYRAKTEEEASNV